MMNNTDAQIVALLNERDAALECVAVWKNSYNALRAERDEALERAAVLKNSYNALKAERDEARRQHDAAVRRAALEEAAKACYAIGEGGDATADPPARSGGADG